MDEENPLQRNSKVEYSNFMLELKYTGFINPETLVRDFELDVQHYINENGLFLVQNDKIIQNPYDVSFSTQKINKLNNIIPIGFTKISYAEGKHSLAYSNPPEPIPNGCWCTVESCGGIGPYGHSNICSYPNKLSLKLTLKGFYECVYSNDKVYRSRLSKSDNAEINEMVEYFMTKIDEIMEYTGGEITNDIIIKAAIETTENNNFKLLYKIPSKSSSKKNNDLSTIFTNIRFDVVRNIPELNKGKIEYFPRTTFIQYVSLIDNIYKCSSIRIANNGTITIIPCNWDSTKSYENMIMELQKRINKSGSNIKFTSPFLLVSNGKFRLIPEQINKEINLSTFYSVFFPTDEMGNRLQNNDFMNTETYILENGEEKTLTFVYDGKNKYSYDIKDNQSKLMMNFTKYEDDIPTNYKVNIQLYSTSNVDLVFSYRNKETKQVEKQIINSMDLDDDIYGKINSQIKIIKYYFELIRKFVVNTIDKMYKNGLDIYQLKEINKNSDKIFNVVPGVMPYGKKKNMYAGYIVDFFDDERHEWDDNYGWSIDDSERGVIIQVNKNKNSEDTYYIITGEPFLSKIVETPDLINFKIKTSLYAPLVELENGENAYLIEDYIEGKSKHWVIMGDIYEYSLIQLRVHKQSINDNKIYTKDTQVCDKTKNGMDIRPDPYSFYGRCSGGLSQYIDRIGVQSRKDNKFYPTCVQITDGKTTQTSKNRKEVENEIVNFIMDGLNDEQLKSANIDPNIEVYMHGVPIQDKYAGTFKPGTIDIGNKITFWDENNQIWTEGTLIKYKKSHGLGNDLNHTRFIIKDINEVEHDVKGDNFHPRHRESRNFPGLNNIFDKEEDRKNVLINCAKKLNLVKSDIQIEEAKKSVQSKVLKKLGNVINNVGTFSNVTTKIEPFIEKNITNLTKIPYVSLIIPSDYVRCILFIVNNQNEQYLIDSYDKVRQISIQFETDIVNTIVDGYITEKNEFYPFDLLYYNGYKNEEDYLTLDEFNESYGRLIDLQTFCYDVINIKVPNSIVIKKPLGTYGKQTTIKNNVQINPFIGPIEPYETLIQFVKKYRGKTNDLLFIPQIGNSKYMIWKHYVPNNPIVMQLLKPAEFKNSWYLGLNEITPEGFSVKWILLKTPILLNKIKDEDNKEITFKKGDFIKFRLNIMTNGILNENMPYINPSKVTEDEVKNFEDTKIELNLITRSIKEEVFNDFDSWEFSKIKKVFISDTTSRFPLKEKKYKYT